MQRSLTFLLVVLFGAGCAVSRLVSPPPPLSDYILSQLEIGSLETGEALQRLNRVVEAEPGNAHVWYKRGLLRASLGDLKGGGEDLRRALTINPDHPEALLTLAKIQLGEGHYEEAVKSYRHLLRLDPQNEEVYPLLFQAHIAAKQYEQAIRVMEEWSGVNPANLQPLFSIASVQQNLTKDLPKTIATYNRILEVDSGNVRALSSLAGLYLEKGDERNAKRILERMREAAAEDLNLQLKMALIHYEAKRYDEAIGDFREILKLHPDADRIIYYLGVILENVEKGDEALSEFAKIRQASRFFKDARLHIAFIHHRLGRDDEAILVLLETLKTLPEEPSLYEYLAEIYSRIHRYDEAVRWLKAGLREAREKEGLQYSLGLVYDRAGRHEEGVGAMKKVLKLNPNNAHALNYIGYTYAERNQRLTEALALIQKALLLKPEDGFITDSLGWVYYRMGDMDQAYLYIRRAYDLIPGEVTITEHLGDVFQRMSDGASARRYFQESLEILEKRSKDPDIGPDIERLKTKIEKLQGL